MPYAAEHSARLKDPKRYIRIRKQKNKFGPGIHAQWGILRKGGKETTELQSIHFDASKFTVAQAKKWLAAHDYKPILFEAAKPPEKSKASAELARRTAGESEVVMCSGPVEFVAGGDDGPEGKPKRFRLTAYTGGVMQLDGWFSPVVIDLAGLKLRPGAIPVLKNHDMDQIVGHADRNEITQQRLKLSGVISGAGDAAREVVESSRNGFPWRASVRARAHSTEYVREGTLAKANGKTFQGPINIVRKSELAEVSFVPVAADAATAAEVAAQAREPEGGKAMTFEEWLKAKGFEDVSEEQTETLKAAYEAEMKAASGADEDAEEEPAGDQAATVAASAPHTRDNGAAQPGKPKTAVLELDATKAIQDIRGAAGGELGRIAGIHKLCGDHPDIEAKAVAEGWSQEKAELEVLRASRPTPPAIVTGGKPLTPLVLEAAIRLGGVEPADRIEKAYEEKVLEAADGFRHMGLKELIAVCSLMDGQEVPRPGSSPERWLQAAFSTTSLPGILGAAANKTLLSAYQAFPSAARKIAKKLSANDFKVHTGYRLTADSVLKPVGQDGELKHMTLGEQEYPYSVGTYGRILAITRQMIVNDDLNAFTDIPSICGRGAALALEEAFWTLVLANTGTFFGVTNTNYISGATSALGSTSLATAVQTFADQVDTEGNPVVLNPKYLVMPSALLAVGQELYVSRNIVISRQITAAAAAKLQPSANIHNGLYEPVMSPYLGNTSFHASASATAWYLFANPADVGAFGIAYLKGNENPVFEAVSLPADVLGQGWRIYFDFGVCQIDHRAAVMSAGA